MVASEHDTTVIGVISDTHGLVRPEAIDALAGADRLVHAGMADNSILCKRFTEPVAIDYAIHV